MNVDINSYQALVYFNIYIIKSVFFGCRVIELNPKEVKELKQIYKEPMLIKLGFSKKFPRTALYIRKSVLGVEMIKPETIIAILKLKQYIRNVKKPGNAGKSIRIQEEY